MRDELRTIHIMGEVWLWELIDGVKFPHVRIISPYEKVFKEHAEYFLLPNERYLGHQVNIIPSKIYKYIEENLLKEYKLLNG